MYGSWTNVFDFFKLEFIFFPADDIITRTKFLFVFFQINVLFYLVLFYRLDGILAKLDRIVLVYLSIFLFLGVVYFLTVW